MITIRRKKGDYNLAFIDMLLAMLSFFVVLFFVAAAAMSPVEVKDANVKSDAQVIINIDWPVNIDCDVDLYVKYPNDSISFYQAKDLDGGNLERDDLGHANDTIYMNGEKVVSPINHENWSMRSIMPGTYRANVHLYKCSALHTGVITEVPVVMEILKINPVVERVGIKKIVLDKLWEESLGLMFNIDQAGSISQVEETDQLFVDEVQTRVSGNP